MEFILDLLKQDYISNVYIGVTGILVAIVIFIAEIIKDQNNELNKKVILHKTNIKNYVIDVLLIFFYMLIVNMLKYNEENSICEFYNIIYVITHISLLGFVILSIYRTGKIFWITLKLNTEKDYFNKELEKYKVELERNRHITKTQFDKEFEIYHQLSKSFFSMIVKLSSFPKPSIFFRRKASIRWKNWMQPCPLSMTRQAKSAAA